MNFILLEIYDCIMNMITFYPSNWADIADGPFIHEDVEGHAHSVGQQLYPIWIQFAPGTSSRIPRITEII